MIYVLLPAYNEEQGLQKVLPALKSLRGDLDSELRVVVVNDGSSDRTVEVVRSFQKQMDVHLIDFPKNQGVGEVFRQGFRYVIQDSPTPMEDVCVVLDSDNTQDPTLIPLMVSKVHGGADVVIASRFESGGKMIGCPWPRQLLSFGVGTLLRVFVGLRGVKDYSTFYRAYRVQTLEEGFRRYGDGLLEGKGFAVMGAMLIRLSNITQHMTEVPLVLRYDLKGGSSGIKLWRTIRGYIELIVKSIRTRRFSRT